MNKREFIEQLCAVDSLGGDIMAMHLEESLEHIPDVADVGPHRYEIEALVNGLMSNIHHAIIMPDAHEDADNIWSRYTDRMSELFKN